MKTTHLSRWSLAEAAAPRGADPVRRVLVVDDNPSIGMDFRKLLCSDLGATALDDLDGALFGSAQPSSTYRFQVDWVSQGREGVDAVRRQQSLGRPYALTFVDMRMPPGIDGVETLEQVYAVSNDIEAVICSAYSDYSWHEVIRRLGRPGIRLLLKPFTSNEVLDLAWTLTTKWKSRNP